MKFDLSECFFSRLYISRNDVIMISSSVEQVQFSPHQGSLLVFGFAGQDGEQVVIVDGRDVVVFPSSVDGCYEGFGVVLVLFGKHLFLFIG